MKLKTQKLVISSNGTISAIYNDDLAGLLDAGDAQITRASHVEPGPGNRWTADLTPVSGPALGPFDLRQDALDAEVRYLESRLGSL